MYLSQVWLKNFRGYGENPSRADGLYIFDNLDNPFTILNGFNGFGKTSFMEAIEWCITDEITRLKDIEEIYDVRDLRKSYYLKYYHPKLKNIEDREIEVTLVFSNGIRVKRTSRSNSHKTKNDNNYKSFLVITNDESVETSATENVLLKLFVKGESSASRLLKTHVLGQESINDFVRSNNPATRRSIFMQLLDLTEIDTIHRGTTKLKASRDFFNKKKEIGEKLNNLETKLNGINTFFESRNFGGMENYISILHEKSKELQGLNDNSVEEIKLGEPILQTPITIDICVYYLATVEKKKNAIFEDIEKWEGSLTNLITLQETITSITLLDQGIGLYNRLEQAQALQSINYPELLRQEEESAKVLLRLEAEKLEAEVLSNKLTQYKQIFGNLSSLFSTEKNTIDETFGSKIISLNEKYKEFVNTFHKEFENANLKVEIITENELSKLSFLQQTYEKYYSDIINIKSEIFAKEEELRNISSLNESYSQLLNQVKQYITSTTNISECPVCLNSNFTSEKYDSIVVSDSSTQQKLLDIIDHKVSAGNSIVRSLSECITALRLSETNITNKIKNEVLVLISTVVTKWKEKYELAYFGIKSYIHKKLDTVLTELKEKNEIKKQQDILRTRFEECCKAIMQEEVLVSIHSDTVHMIVNNLEKELERWNQTVLSKQTFSLSPTRDEVVEKVGMLQQKEGVLDYYPDNTNLLLSKIKNYQRNIAYGKKLLSMMEDILKLSIPVEYQEKFSEYNSLATQIASEKDRLFKVSSFETAIKNLNSNTTRVQGSIIDKKLRAHPIISWIYEAINPHPFYKKLIISSDTKGTHFKNETEDICLDHLFSSAQLNVLALSVFLGLGLTQEYSQLEHLFLDDPIQSMDDVNILAFIDILRGIMDSKYRNKRLIISTHDDNFAQLLAIKLRNKEFTQYNFVGYGVEGPIIKKNINYI